MVSIIVPTLNEVDNIEPLVRRIMQCEPAPDEIVFVDDASTDGTPGRIRSLMQVAPVRLVERDTPALGLSGAIIAGARAASSDLIVVMDGDLSHPPEKLVELWRPIEAGVADMVIGSRYVGGASTPGWPLWRKLLSRAAAALAYPLTGVSDSMCGFFAIRRATLLTSTTKAYGFKIAFEAIVHAGSSLRVLEIPIVFRDRSQGVSKMTLRVAVLFALRWLAAVSKLRRRKPTPVFYHSHTAIAPELPAE